VLEGPRRPAAKHIVAMQKQSGDVDLRYCNAGHRYVCISILNEQVEAGGGDTLEMAQNRDKLLPPFHPTLTVRG
jgi:hypothetical protein